AKPKKVAAALAKLDKAMDQAIEHTSLARDRGLQRALLDQISALYGGPRLLDLTGQAPWEELDHPAVTGAIRDSEAIIVAAALDRTTALRGEVYPGPVAGRDRSATTTATGRDTETPGAPVAGEAAPISAEGRSWLAALVPWSRPDPRPVAEDLRDRQPVAEAVAETVAEEGSVAEVVATESRPVADRKRPDEQDKRRAIRLWISRAKRGNVGSKRDLANWTDFSETWALGCIQEARQIMIN